MASFVDRPYFKPWIGEKYSTTKLLILSESAYDWRDDEGELRTPLCTHPKASLLWSIKNFREVRYFTQMNRALCGSEIPAQLCPAHAFPFRAIQINSTFLLPIPIKSFMKAMSAPVALNLVTTGGLCLIQPQELPRTLSRETEDRPVLVRLIITR